MVFDRRTFLCGAASTAFVPGLLLRALRADAAGSGTILVIFNFGGGNDGFNTVIPLKQYGTYMDLRPTIGVTESAIAAAGTAFDVNYSTPASAATTYAFNPTMTKMRAAYAQGNLAVIMGSALPPNASGLRDHPVAAFNWQSGAINDYLATTIGWGGAALDQAGTVAAGIAPMISTSGQSPLLFGSSKNESLAFSGTLDGFVQSYPSVPATSASLLRASTADLESYATPESASELYRLTEAQTSSALMKVSSLAAAQKAADYITATNGISSNIKLQFQQVARMILAGNDSKMYYTYMNGGQTGSFDTHSSQLKTHPLLLQHASEAMVEFIAYLSAKNSTLAQRVVVMSVSEFGRKPNENSTGGTDHGSSSVHFCMGAGVKGGVYGAFPSLLSKDLQGDGYAAVTVDFRNYLSDVISAIGADPQAIVGSTYAKLGFI